MSHQVENLFFMALREGAGDRDNASWVMIPDPLASLAQLGLRVFRACLRPLPSPMVEHRATFRAEGWFTHFSSGFVGIVHTFMDETILTFFFGNFCDHMICRVGAVQGLSTTFTQPLSLSLKIE